MYFEELQDEAKLALGQADPLCAEANNYYQQCRADSETALVLWAKAQFFQEAFQSQLQIMGNAYILLNHTIQGAEKTARDSLSRLTKSSQALDGLLKKLSQTKLDDGRTLYSFVHEADIKSLQDQVETLTDALNIGSGALTKLPGQVQKEIAALRDSMPTLESQDLVKTLSQTTTSAAENIQDMAELLDSVTRHYDLCLEASTLQDQQEIEEVKQVLEQDRIQLGDALETLKAHYTLVQNYHKTAENATLDLEQSLAGFASFFNRSDIFIRQKLRMYLDRLEAHNLQLNTRNTKVGNLIDEVNGLCEYYKLFQQGYAALLQEKQRRSVYDDQLATLITQINTEISKQYQRELNTRTEFIQQFGEYLPNDIWDRLYDVPKLYVLSERAPKSEDH